VVRCLSLHAHYRCRDSGACCSSGWPIPIEIPLYERLVDSLQHGAITTVRSVAPFTPTRGLPEGAAAVLGQTADGRCAFYEADAATHRCRIQRHSGHAAIPIACQQFPRMCLIDPRGVLEEFGLTLPQTKKIRVWDSTAELRYIVIPERPEGTEGLDQEALADLVTRDAMIGTALAREPA